MSFYDLFITFPSNNKNDQFYYNANFLLILMGIWTKLIVAMGIQIRIIIIVLQNQKCNSKESCSNNQNRGF